MRRLRCLTLSRSLHFLNKINPVAARGDGTIIARRKSNLIPTPLPRPKDGEPPSKAMRRQWRRTLSIQVNALE